MISLGPFNLQSRVLLAPMAGISDYPVRVLCQGYGAGLTTSEMITSKQGLWTSNKTRTRLKKTDNSAVPHSVQIVGSDPDMMAAAAKEARHQGAEIVDINMGCPAKKVCKKLAGSALLADERQVACILEAVVTAVDVPVTLKIRTGVTPSERNAVTIGKIAEACGVQMLTIHGRTRADRFNGQAEYDTIARVVDELSIPVIANGDIQSVSQAVKVLDYTRAAGIMIGRGVQGQPWFIAELVNLLGNQPFIQPNFLEKCTVIRKHLSLIHSFYGAVPGLGIARKHIGWYLDRLLIDSHYKKTFNQLLTIKEQIAFIDQLPSFRIKGKIA